MGNIIHNVPQELYILTLSLVYDMIKYVSITVLHSVFDHLYTEVCVTHCKCFLNWLVLQESANHAVATWIVT